MLTIKKAEKVHEGLTRIDYQVTHSTPGRDGTTLTTSLKMNVMPGETTVELTVPECQGSIPTEALDKLCVYLDRIKEGILKRRDTFLPV